MKRKYLRRGASSIGLPFIICTVILGVTALGLPGVSRYMHVVLLKEPIALRSPLSRLDKSRMGPFKFVKAKLLDSAIVNTLGTDQYIQWFFEDEAYAGTSNPLRYVNVFITYYTGQPDAVPHTPDVCLIGGGYTIESARNTEVPWPDSPASPTVPVRIVNFIKTGIFNAESMPVVYTFHCNGDFIATREGVRTAANDPRDKYSYFSKVEISFGWSRARPRYPSREEALAGTARLFEHLLPLLVNEHWPDWEAAKQADNS